MKQLLIVLGCCASSMAFSASFDCDKAKTLSEIMICENKDLSALDSQMAKAYKIALSKSASVKAEQQEWLNNVRDDCKDEDCLKQVYQARLKQLNTPSTGITGEYQRRDKNASIKIENADNGQVHITGDAVWIGNADTGNVHVGELDGVFPIKNKQVHYKSGDEDYDCTLTITINGNHLSVTNDNGHCGGMNVSFNGEYRKQ